MKTNGIHAQTLLHTHGFHFTHSLGQNFIFDDDLIEEILDAAGVIAGQNVLEIGPGAGVMTAAMAARGAHVLAIEIDTTLQPVLSDMLKEFGNVKVVYQDALKCDLRALTDETFSGDAFRVVANLPYFITTDLIQKMLRADLNLTSIGVMVQAEAAERIMAAPGEKAYCALAATVQFYAKPHVAMTVPPEAFTPRPHVVSQFLLMDMYAEKPVQPRDEAMLMKLICASFLMRRKTMANNLSMAFGLRRETALHWLETAGLNEKVRGEALSLSELSRLADAWADIKDGI